MHHFKSILCVICLFAIACSNATPEGIGESMAALTNYSFEVIRVYKTHDDFLGPDRHPEFAGGGVDQHIQRLTRNAMVVSFDYGNVPSVNLSGIEAYCNFNALHDAELLLTNACSTLVYDGWNPNLSNYRGVMLQVPYLYANEFGNGCNLGTSIGTKISANVQYWCGGNDTTAGIYNIKGDGPTNPPYAQFDKTLVTLHEVLHTLPSPTPTTDQVGHDDSIYCSSGILTCVTSVNPNCTCPDQSAARTNLGVDSGDANLSNWNTTQEPVEYQIRAGWVPVNRRVDAPKNITGNQTVYPSDASTYGQFLELSLPLPNNPNLNARRVVMEYRANNWIGGCSPGNWTAPPCGSVNRPGVYAWLVEGASQPSYRQIRFSNDPNSTNMGGHAPMVVGTTYTFEAAHAWAQVQSVDGTKAVIKAWWN